MTRREQQARQFLDDSDGTVTDEHVRLAVGYLDAEAEAARAVKRHGRFDASGKQSPAARAERQARDGLVKLRATIDAQRRAHDRRAERKSPDGDKMSRADYLAGLGYVLRRADWAELSEAERDAEILAGDADPLWVWGSPAEGYGFRDHDEGIGLG